MSLLLSLKRFGGIEFTHAGDPLADGRYNFAHCVRADRLTGGSQSSAVEAGEDEDVAELRFFVREATEGRLLVEVGAEVAPLVPLTRLLPASANCVDGTGFREDRHEMSCSECCESRWSSRQGLSCG